MKLSDGFGEFYKDGQRYVYGIDLARTDRDQSCMVTASCEPDGTFTVTKVEWVMHDGESVPK